MAQINMRQWRQISRPISVTAAPKTVPLAPKGTWLPRAYVWADVANTDYVSVGGREMSAALGAAVNTCLEQLNPGCGMDIFVDDPETESFDLADYYACSKSAVVQTIHVTIFTFSKVRVQVTSA